MSQNESYDQRVVALASTDGRYTPDAYHFVFRALDFVTESDDEAEAVVGPLESDRHVTSTQLLGGLRAFALDLYGPLARLVLERWGIFRTEDFGEIVFRLVEAQLLNKQDSDRKSDFRNGFNFREAFDKARWPAFKWAE